MTITTHHPQTCNFTRNTKREFVSNIGPRAIPPSARIYASLLSLLVVLVVVVVAGALHDCSRHSWRLACFPVRLIRLTVPPAPGLARTSERPSTTSGPGRQAKRVCSARVLWHLASLRRAPWGTLANASVLGYLTPLPPDGAYSSASVSNVLLTTPPWQQMRPTSSSDHFSTRPALHLPAVLAQPRLQRKLPHVRGPLRPYYHPRTTSPL